MAYLAAHLREEDKAEYAALTGKPFSAAALVAAVAVPGKAFVALDRSGKPWCLFGLTDSDLIWLVGTPRLAHNARQLLHYGRAIIKVWLRKYGRVHNIISRDNKPAIRTLRKLGFVFGAALCHGTFISFQQGA